MSKPWRAGLMILTMLALPLLAMNSAHADEFADALAQFHESEATQPFFNNAYGYAIFPNVGKGGVGIGGAYGKGRVYRGGNHVGDVSLIQLSFGFQLGGQVFSELIFFENKEAFDWFTGGSFSFDAQASAVAIATGAGIQAGTTGVGANATQRFNRAVYLNGVAVFSMQKGGLMYEASLSGQKFSYSPR
jgi:lipid-binding SYLF domain-containing protein